MKNLNLPYFTKILVLFWQEWPIDKIVGLFLLVGLRSLLGQPGFRCTEAQAFLFRIEVLSHLQLSLPAFDYKLLNMENNLKIDELQLNKISSKLLSLTTQKKMGTDNGLKTEAAIKRKYKRKEKQLTPQQVDVFKQAFQIFDADHSGNIDCEELTSLLNALGFDYSQAQIVKIFEQVDADGSGVIQIQQFVKFMSRQILDTQNIKVQILKVFKHFDDDNSGFLDASKIKNMLGQCFFNLDDAAINQMIAVADTDGDGKINEYQFLRIMKKVKLI